MNNASRLVITADDFGAAVAVNEAVEIAHRDGILSAASLMVAGPAAADAVKRARDMPDLRVGLHLVLTDGRPVLPAAQVDRLVGRDGQFSDNMAAAGARMFFDPLARRQLADEIAAQFEAFAATGLRLDHANAHKHFHLHPTIARLIIEIGARHGLAAVRTPIEPVGPLAAAEPDGKARPDRLMTWWAKAARARVRRAGLTAPDQVFGLRWSGAMGERRLAGLIAALPPGLSEIYLHPATDDRFAGAARGYRYGDELAALTSASAAAALAQRGAVLGGFADFAP
ncbi:MAG TPA: hopanoid biosynthesis-associated protein HpnK [Caulobacteraceae bacterium]